MEDLLKLLIEPLVADFGKVKIEKNSSDDYLQFIIFIPKEEIAKVIGKEGKMIKSIKNLAKIRAIKENLQVALEVKEL